MVTIGSYEAKTHLPSLLRRVEAGEHITITRNGIPVARIVPVSDVEPISPSSAIDKLITFGRGRRLGEGLTVRGLIQEGRR